jgi:hypothetical protein
MLAAGMVVFSFAVLLALNLLGRRAVADRSVMP